MTHCWSLLFYSPLFFKQVLCSVHKTVVAWDYASGFDLVEYLNQQDLLEGLEVTTKLPSLNG